jgi:hypothetical protein
VKSGYAGLGDGGVTVGVAEIGDGAFVGVDSTARVSAGRPELGVLAAGGDVAMTVCGTRTVCNAGGAVGAAVAHEASKPRATAPMLNCIIAFIDQSMWSSSCIQLRRTCRNHRSLNSSRRLLSVIVNVILKMRVGYYGRLNFGSSRPMTSGRDVE